MRGAASQGQAAGGYWEQSNFTMKFSKKPRLPSIAPTESPHEKPTIVSKPEEATKTFILWKYIGDSGSVFPPMIPFRTPSIPSSSCFIPKERHIEAWNRQYGEPESTIASIERLGGECL